MKPETQERACVMITQSSLMRKPDITFLSNKDTSFDSLDYPYTHVSFDFDCKVYFYIGPVAEGAD